MLYSPASYHSLPPSHLSIKKLWCCKKIRNSKAEGEDTRANSKSLEQKINQLLRQKQVSIQK
jgi:hypothetical protein